MESRPRDADNLHQLKAEADRLLLELTGADRVFGQAHTAFRPHTDVYFSKSREALIIKLELAGIDPSSVHLEAEERVVRIRGGRVDTSRADKVYQQMEIDYGYFERVLNLPVDVNPQEATAQYDAGFLEVILPLPPHSGLRRIPVNIRDSGSDMDEEGSAT